MNWMVLVALVIVIIAVVLRFWHFLDDRALASTWETLVESSTVERRFIRWLN